MRKIATFFLLFSLPIFAEPPPLAKDILASVRMMEARQQIDLQGQLRQDNVVVPFHLVQNGPLIRYSFANPDEVLQLRLGENSSRLELVTGGGSEQFATSKLKQKIRGTSVTYEDLAFKFLYWPSARVLGEENVRTRNCWKLQLRAPSRESKNCSLGVITSRRERTWRLKGRNLALSKFVRPNGTCVTNAIMRPKKESGEPRPKRVLSR